MDTHRRIHAVTIKVPSRGRRVRAECPTLGEDVVADIEPAVATDAPRRRLTRALRAVCQKHGVYGLVVRYKGVGPELRIPPPIDFAFEPVELDETQPSLLVLLKHAHRDKEAYEPGTGRSTVRYLVLKFARPLVTAMDDMRSGIFDVVGASGMVGIALVVLSVPVLVVRRAVCAWRDGRWFLVPSGVVVRRPVVGSFERRLRRCAAEDSILIMMHAPGGWHAVIFHAGSEYARWMSDTEAAALLSAWQSPLDAPDDDQLRGVL